LAQRPGRGAALAPGWLARERMASYGLFDFDEDADDCSYPHRLEPGAWEVFEAWAFDPASGDAIFDITLEHKSGAARLGVALSAGREAVASSALCSLAQGREDPPPETGIEDEAAEEAEPFVVLLEFPASEDSWRATFGRAAQLLAGRPHGRRAAPWSERQQSSLWLAAYTARDGRFQLDMGLGSHPDNRLFRAKFGAGPPPFTHVGLAGIQGPGGEAQGGEEEGVVLRDVRVQRGLSLDPAPAPGAALEAVAAEEGDAEASAEGGDVEGPGGDAGEAGAEAAPDAAPAFDGFAALAAIAGALAEERRQEAEEPCAEAEEAGAPAACPEEPEEEVVPSWRLPGGCEGRSGGVLVSDAEREALIPSLASVLERLDAEEEGYVSASTNHYDPRPSKEATTATLAMVAGESPEAPWQQGSLPADVPSAGSTAQPLPVLAEHPFVPVAEEDAEAQRGRAEGLRARMQRLRSDRARRREERIAELREAHKLEEAQRNVGVPPRNLGLGRPAQNRQAADGSRSSGSAVPPWLRNPG